VSLGHNRRKTWWGNYPTVEVTKCFWMWYLLALLWRCTS